MSLNHYSSNFPEPQGWSESSEKTPSSNAGLWGAGHRQLYCQYNCGARSRAGDMFCGGSTAFSFNLNNEDEEELLGEQMAADDREINSTSKELEREQREIPKEPLFEKSLTPSDVGKLNRLVIPKQHAEKNFPLSGGDSSEKGLLLTFEDEVGKSWRFRYSYWNSSQSYVLTKGWSRFVKEKRLDAGDSVLFSRHREDVGRLFIGWRRRKLGGEQESGVARPPPGGGGGGGGCGWSRLFYPGGYPYPSQHQTSSSLPYQPNCSHAGSGMQNQTTAAAAVSGNSKRHLRLFGVNLECLAADESDPSTPEGSPMSSHQHPYHQY